MFTKVAINPDEDIISCKCDIRILEEGLTKNITLVKLSIDDENEDKFEEVATSKMKVVGHETARSELPSRSKEIYIQCYKQLMDWRQSKNANSFSEKVLLAYFWDISKTMKPTTLWKIYSMLRTTININHNVDLSTYSELRAFLKKQSHGYKVKKSKTLTPEDVNRFLTEAPDYIYLGTKVALIVGIMGSCRKAELYSLKLQDIQYLDGNTALISIPDNRSKTSRLFKITGSLFDTFKKYADLRPPNAAGTDNFFLNYQKGRCTKQVIGINKFGNMAKQIACFLGLPDPEMYTGHCFRRTSANLLVEADIL